MKEIFEGLFSIIVELYIYQLKQVERKLHQEMFQDCILKGNNSVFFGTFRTI